MRCHLDGHLEVLDEDEFEEARQTLNMPTEVVTKAREALDDIVQLAQQGIFPFDHEVQMRRLK
ncbi:MAG: putative RNA-binding protein associated with RNAse of E/G family [Candidatus Latescibacterota bacterium]